MCNLYSLTPKRDAVGRFFRVSHNRTVAFEPVNAIFPRHVAPVVRYSADGEREIVTMSWGFLRLEKGRAPKPVTNVRDDQIQTNPFWRGSFRQRRCLVPASSFCEPNGDVKPATWNWFAINDGIDARPLFAFPGIWRSYKGPVKKDGPNVDIETYAFLTTTPNPLVATINHERYLDSLAGFIWTIDSDSRRRRSAVKKTPRAGSSSLRRDHFHPSTCVESRGSSMITLLERRAVPGVEVLGSGWGRQFQPPSIRRDGGIYDADLDRFLADLPVNGVRSLHSQRSYAYDLLVWVRFLDEARGKTVWQATRDDVDSYHRARRHGDSANRISAASWNRAVAALDKLYRWAIEDGVISESPFAYRDVWRRLPSGRGRSITVTRNQAYERAAKRSDVKFITMEDYGHFRRVGLQGLALDGSERRGARDRNGGRNALFADLLISTGLRLEEASSLLACEIEEAIRATVSGDKQVAFRLPAALTKGDKGRTIRIPANLLTRLRSYLEVERANGVAKFQARGGSQRMRGTIMVGIQGSAMEVMSRHGNRVPLRLENVTPDERRRLVLCDRSGKALEPASFWLSEIGLPIAPNSWEAVFARASRRCQDAGVVIDVSPHQLRHSFAVHMLDMLIRQRFGDVANEADLSGASYRQLLGDPLLQVQRLLGHSSLATTYIYLNHLAACHDTIDTAVEELFAAIESPSSTKVAA